jgi:hypothetical protein
MYGKFLVDVLDNEDDAELLFLKADQIEEDGGTMSKTLANVDEKSKGCLFDL